MDPSGVGRRAAVTAWAATGPPITDIARRHGRPVAFGLAVVLGAFALVRFIVTLTGPFGAYVGYDLTHYVEASIRWLAVGTPYLANEVAGPFLYQPETFLHPPIALYLFTPFIAFPAILWWIFPICAVVGTIFLWRPAAWTWPILAFIALWPRTQGAVIVGNSDLWIAGFLALGLWWSWPGLLMVIKPSFLPLALMGIQRRSWWVAAAAVVIVAVPFGQLWSEWVSVISHAPTNASYSAPALPLILAPIIAWFGRTHDSALGPGPHTAQP